MLNFYINSIFAKLLPHYASGDSLLSLKVALIIQAICSATFFDFAFFAAFSFFALNLSVQPQQ